MRQKELRLALICYGGVSLAIYMHGITKEVWKLAKASRDFHDGEKNHQCSRGTYYDILQWMERETGVKLRILPDIIAGASAGGIRSEEHTSELQSRSDLVCRLLLEKKKHMESQQLDVDDETPNI